MGGYFSTRIANGNHVANTVDVHVYDTSDLTEEIKVPDATSKHKSKSFTKKIESLRKTTSLQSAVSVPQQNGKHIDDETERLKRLNDSLSLSHEKEVTKLNTHIVQLQDEVSHLRKELKVLNTTLMKVRADKEKAKIAETDAWERASGFEQGTVHL